MDENELAKFRAFVTKALQEWHNPKEGRTLQWIYDQNGLAPSNLRKIIKGDANPSFTTCYRILTAIYPKETVYEVMDSIFSDSHVRNLAATKPSSVRIESRDDAWFVLKISNAEVLPIEYVVNCLGANHSIVMEKFTNNGYVSIDNGTIYVSNSNNELMDEASFRNIGHFILDSTYTSKDSDLLSCRSFRTSPEKAKKGREILSRANKELSELFKEETESSVKYEQHADFAFVLAGTVV